MPLTIPQTPALQDHSDTSSVYVDSQITRWYNHLPNNVTMDPPMDTQLTRRVSYQKHKEKVVRSKQKTIAAANGLTSSSFSTQEASLVVVDGPHAGLTLPLEKELIRIGRADWCDLILPDDKWVSNIHCECWLDERGLRLRDLNSRNGIKIAKIPVFDAYLPPDTTFEVGQSLIQLRSNQQKREIPVNYQDDSGTIVGKSQEMRKIFSMISRLGKCQVATLLTGETGTGKTSIAKAIHTQSQNAQAPFVVVNCGALPAGLIEAALFGHEKGAFTGANKSHAGFFEQANGGTLFLDEIGELPLDLQPKLLDVLERKAIRRLGSEKERTVDFRLISATHRNLQKEIQAKRFREDLFFRISVVEIEVPPLRERAEDIPLLVEMLLRNLRENESLYVDPQVISALEEYLWPGNIRELRNVLERSITFLNGDTITLQDLVLPKNKEALSSQSSTTSKPVAAAPKASSVPASGQHTQLLPTFPLTAHDPPLLLKDILVEAERIVLAQALEEMDLSAPDAAKLLGISESWLYNRIKRYGLNSQRKKPSSRS